MAIQASHCSLAILILLCSVACIASQGCNPPCRHWPPYSCNNTNQFNRRSFPKNFIFGGATSAYQVEGSQHRAANSWDLFVHKYPERVPDRATGDLACDSYNLYKDDVALLKRMNADAYRFSIAWSRVLPKGKLSGGVDERGINYYNRLINELKNNSIEPFVTIFHWDVPLTLEDEYGGFLNRQIVYDFRDYAELLFQRFGDRVKYWITTNQPFSLASKGYGDGTYPPGRCTKCFEGGNSGTEPYIVAHHELLAHAETVALYRKKYKKLQGGKIGNTMISRWFIPLNETSEADRAAVQRGLDFFFGWFMDPMVFGDYPESMKELVGDRLPKFTKEESNMLRGSLDFLGLNYYFTQYVYDTGAPDPYNPDWQTDSQVALTFKRDGEPIGPEGANFYYYPPGFVKVLNYIKDRYNNPLIYITENGISQKAKVPLSELLDDQFRIEYHCSHLSCLKCAMQNGSNVAGYFAWSSMDNYEFGNGFDILFGMNYVNMTDPKVRKPKRSADWFKNFLQKSLVLDQ